MVLAAVAKLSQSDFPETSRLLARAGEGWQWLAAEIELLVGLWLLLGRPTLNMWRCAIGIFSVLAIVSARMTWLGEPTCGCLGNAVDLSPKLMVALDVLIVALLFVGRPSGIDLKSPQPTAKRLHISLSSVSVFFVVVFLLIAISGLRSMPPISLAAARVRGDPIHVHPVDFFWRTSDSDGQKNVELTLQNITSRPTRVIGAITECSCFATRDLPVTIAAGAKVNVRATVSYDNKIAGFDRRIRFITHDHENEVATFVSANIRGYRQSD